MQPAPLNDTKNIELETVQGKPLDAAAEPSTPARSVDAVAEPSASARSADAGDSNNNYAALDHNVEVPKATKNAPIPETEYKVFDTGNTYELTELRYQEEFERLFTQGLQINFIEAQGYINSLVQKLKVSFPDYLATPKGTAGLDDLKNKLRGIVDEASKAYSGTASLADFKKKFPNAFDESHPARQTLKAELGPPVATGWRCSRGNPE